MASRVRLRKHTFLAVFPGFEVNGALFSRCQLILFAPLIKELPLALECKVMSYDEETELLYAQVVGVSADESILNAKDKVGNAFKDGKKI